MNASEMRFAAFPRVLRAGRDANLVLRPTASGARLPDGAAWRVIMRPMGGLPGQTRHAEPATTVARAVAGALNVRFPFPVEQEYSLHLECPEGEGKGNAEVRVYALEADLFARRPRKGDFHIHSARSDGGEEPAHVAGACRRIGMDFMALTDHRQYAPSLEAIAAFAGTGADLRIFPGEEVHSPDTPVHIVNFGGSRGISDLFATDRYRDEVRQRAAALAPALPAGTDAMAYAACEWCFETIRQAGGLAIFCHPYWVCRSRYDVPFALTDLLLDRQPFDALEVIGGYFAFESESNHLQVARYHAEQAKGRRIPIVGASDAHGCERPELFGWYYSIVFPVSPDLADVTAAVRGLNAVAVEAMPGLAPRAFGPPRLVLYAQFLLRHVLPDHDALCAEEGRLMVAHAGGDTGAAGVLRTLSGRVDRLYDELWDREQ